MLALAAPDLRALVQGESIIAFTRRGAVREGDEVELVASGGRSRAELKPAYARWHDVAPPSGDWTAIVEAVHPTTLLDPDAGSARHVLRQVPTGDLVVLRVYDGPEPVLSTDAYEARRRSIEGALR